MTLILVTLPVFVGCSTVRLTPTAVEHLKNGTEMETIYGKAIEVESDLITALASRGAEVPENYSKDELKKMVADYEWSPEIYSLNKKMEIAKRDVIQLANIMEGDYSYFVEGRLFFSIEPAIAIKSGMQAKAIPSLGINWRVMDAGTAASAIALQGILGGAFNPGSDGEVAGAIGVGLSYPIAGSGSVSGGYVWFGEEDGESGAPYVSVTLGNTGTAVK